MLQVAAVSVECSDAVRANNNNNNLDISRWLMVAQTRATVSIRERAMTRAETLIMGIMRSKAAELGLADSEIVFIF